MYDYEHLFSSEALDIQFWDTGHTEEDIFENLVELRHFLLLRPGDAVLLLRKTTINGEIA